MTTPSLITEISFAGDPNSNPIIAPTWVDVSAYERGVSIRRGRSRQLQRTEAGTATVRLDNRDRRFDPSFTTGPYYPDVKPMRRIRISATWDSGVTTFRLRRSAGGSTLRGGHALRGGIRQTSLFRGYVEAWPQNWQIDKAPIAQLSCVDSFEPMSLDGISVFVRSAELSGARVNAILDTRSWASESGRTVEAGTFQVQAVNYSTPEKNFLEALSEADASEGGILFIARDGKVTFFDRSHPAIALDPVLTWGDGAGEMTYRAAFPFFDKTTIYNIVTVTAPGKADQSSSDATSQQRYFRRVLTWATLLNATADMSTLAVALKNKFKEPALWIRELHLGGTDIEWPKVLERDLWDKIRVRRRPPGGGNTIEQDSLIEGISIDIPHPSHWRVVWTLAAP